MDADEINGQDIEAELAKWLAAVMGKVLYLIEYNSQSDNEGLNQLCSPTGILEGGLGEFPSQIVSCVEFVQ